MTSVRVRLTLWYFAVLTLSFIIFGIAIYLLVRQSVNAAIDADLQDRLAGVDRFMKFQMARPGFTLEDIQSEFREHSGIRQGGDLLQVADSQGNWIFQSASIRNYAIRFPRHGPERPTFETLQIQGSPVRVLSSSIRIGEMTYVVQLAINALEAYQVLDRLRWVLLSAIPALLIVASSGGYWMSRRALAPVDAITKTARSISAENLGERLIVPRTGDELQRLSETLNQMLGRLQSAFRNIKQFTADASHELRTPVALIRTAAELPLRRERNAPEYQAALTQVLAEAERMSALLDTLMALTRMDSGAETLRFSVLDLNALVRDVCSQCRALAQAKDLEFAWELSDQPLLVQGDEHALRRLFLILIDNAIKYTPPRGRVQVRTEARNSESIVRVQDNGIGISDEDLPRVFDRFYRADKARTRGLGGAGLGLSIAKWIADAHGAAIHVESLLGKGSLFEVRIQAPST